MTEVDNRESFIPCDRNQLIELCLENSNFNQEDKQQFRDFCKILTAYYHFKFHSLSEELKHSFTYFNPEEEIEEKQEREQREKKFSHKNDQQNNDVDSELIHHHKINLLKSFRELLTQANYSEVSQKQLHRAFDETSILKLDTVVDFEEFEDMVCYYRGQNNKTIVRKKWFGLKTVTEQIKVLQRVALLIKFKNSESEEEEKQELKEEEKKEEKIDNLKFDPDKIYVYLYKNIPTYDLEFIFPNVKIKMNTKDRVILIVSALGAGIPMLLRILPRLLLVVGVVLFLLTGNVPFKGVSVTKEDVNNILPILLTSVSLLFTFGGFALKQYLGYKNKQIKFQKDVTETLFFRQLGVSLGVFQSIIDEAEEEECKEIILVYYHLLTSSEPLTAEQLDRKIELWLEENIGYQIDFDIESTIDSLREIKGKLINTQDQNQQKLSEISLVKVDNDGCCQALSLDQAKEVIDYTWDNLFEYANS